MSRSLFGSLRQSRARALPAFILLLAGLIGPARAIDDEVAVQNVDYAKLRERLLADKQVLGLK